MTHFEYISIAVSIILGLSIIRLLTNLPAILERGKSYWVHSIWVFTLFWVIIQNWWAFWDFRNIEWNVGYFTLWVIAVSAIYMLVLALIEKKDPKESWKSKYYASHKVFFLSFFVYGLYAVAITIILLDAPIWHPYRLVQAVQISLLLTLGLTNKERVHQFLTFFFLLSMAGGNFIYRFTPDAFG